MLRRMRIAAIGILLAVLAAPPARAADPPLALEPLMAALAQNGPGTVRFAETKTSALLKAPIESSGTLTYAAPSRLEKRTLAPRDERFAVDGETVVIEMAAGTRRKKDASSSASATIRRSARSSRASAARSPATSPRSGATTGSSSRARGPTGGSTSCRPTRSWRMFVLKVVIGGAGGEVRRIEILEASGDRSVMTITKPKERG